MKTIRMLTLPLIVVINGCVSSQKQDTVDENNVWAHFHLIVNDIPNAGFFFTTVFLIVSFISKKGNGWVQAGMLTLAISFIGLLLTFFSGEPALEVIKGQPRTSFKALSEHHFSGLFAMASSIITVILASMATIKARKAGGIYSRNFIISVLIATILSAAALAWTGLDGGRINHFELQKPADHKSGPARPHSH